LTGKGQYTDDLKRPNQTYAHILRSPHGHARIKKIDTKAAAGAPGVVAIFTAKDLAADKGGPLPCGGLVVGNDKKNMLEPAHPALAADTVRYVGDAVALVVAETKAQAKSAAQRIDVDYEALPAAASIDAALASGAPKLWPEGNVCYEWEIGDAAAT